MNGIYKKEKAAVKVLKELSQPLFFTLRQNV